jgi:hypothetical protein
LPSSEVNQLASPDNDSGALRGASYGDSSSPTELQQALIAQETQGTEHGIGVDAQDRSQISGRWHPFSRGCFPLGDSATNFRGHLFVESQGFGTIDLDVRYDDS